MLNPRSKNLILVLVLSLVALPFSANTLLAEENKMTNSATESKVHPLDVNQTTPTPEAAKGVAGSGAAALSPLAIGGIVVLAIAGIAIAADSGSSSGTAIAHNPGGP